MTKRKMSENSLKNLEKGKPFTCEEIARKAQKKAVEVRNGKKQLKEELILLLQAEDNQKKISVALIKQALNGNVKAFEVIRDTIGEKPKDVVENITPPIIEIRGISDDL